MQILEAFRALNALNEDMFSLDSDGIKELSDFKNNDDIEDDISIIDPEAETEEDLQDNYIGKVILDCCVCHSKLYKEKSEVTIDESGELANVGEECPYCFTPDGFKVIGEVTAFEGEESESEDENDADKPEDSEELKEGVFGLGKKKNANRVGGGLPLKGEEEKGNNNIPDRMGMAGPASSGSGLPLKRPDNGNRRSSNIADRMGSDSMYDIDPEYKTTNKKNKSTRNGLRLKDADMSEAYNGAAEMHRPVNSPSPTKDQAKEKDDNYVWAVYDEYGEYVCAYPADKKGLADAKAREMWKAKVKKELIESLQDLSMTANDTHIEVSEDDAGRVTVSAEPVTADGGETIEPISPETEAELMSPEEEIPEEGVEGTEEEVDVDVDEIDENSMDELGESYFRNVYDNVKSFNTTAVRQKDNSLIVEGKIKFTTGRTKRTSFMFEALDATKGGKVRFVGDNKNLTEGKKAFMLTGRMSGNKLIAESLNYNYTHRDVNGKVSRVYGTERTSRR